MTADRRLGRSPGAGYEKAHVAVDDATRLAYVEVRAVSWFNSQAITSRRVLSNNGSAYRSKQWRQACSALGLKAKRTRAYRPKINGKAEWANAMPFNSSEERKRWLPRYLSIDNGSRCHMAIGGCTPFQQLQRLRFTE